MSKLEKWIVESDCQEQRLDLAVSNKYDSISRNLAQEMIKNGEIKVNGAIVKPSFKLKGEEIVEIVLREEDAPFEVVATELDFPVLYEDDYIVVINKPYGLVVHPGAGKETTTVVSAMLGHTSLSSVGSPLRPGVVHRLDKETTGLMVLAKTQQAHTKLVEMFSSQQVEKEYFAIVGGRIANRRGRVEVAIERDKVHRKRMKATSNQKGKLALSRFEAVEYLKDATLVRVTLVTGRTHQIRVHMAFTGHPLLGDTLYGGKKLNKQAEHFLHSSRLSFSHPITGQSMEFEAPLPGRFAEVLEQMRK